MTNYLSFQVHGNADHGGGGPAENMEDVLIFITELVGKQPLEILATLLPGVTALQNIHPMLVHLPIAFLLGFFVVDLIGAFAYKPAWRSVASWFLYFGTITALVTVCAGFYAASTVEHGGDVHEIMERHEHLGLSILGLACFLSLWRFNVSSLICDIANTFFMMLSTLLCILVFLGADLGGLMVYKYGVGVAGVQQASHDHNQATIMAPSPETAVVVEETVPVDDGDHRHDRGRRGRGAE
ncbi:DUF2231 domain-containing protein [Crenothrix polyspora]|uniref:DUF2231 domain-containing protein n=1 Tax=Crenothrix polyspora TaxID=360316 RepID=A0A1R4HH86_9GAMM|nr:DUF2231 domain-containing protein [Crenothrix polyspora]SJM95240.1 conserved membrane hypothetical protein [Crenothrix polyspora]